MKKKVIIFIILDIVALLGIFLAYGPITYFREFLITTAMTTKSHKYLAKTFYSDHMINKVLSNNYVEEVDEDTNASDIVFKDNSNNYIYESIYEEQILKKENPDDLYKIVTFSGNDYKAYLTVIYDPSRISLATTKHLGVRGEYLRTIANDNDAIVAINAGGFSDAAGLGDGGISTGAVIKNGKVIWNGPETGWTGGLIGFNKDNILILSKENPYQAVKNGMRDAIEFGPFLIVNGKTSYIKGNGGWGKAPRTAIAQRKDGIVLFLVIDGNGVKKGYRGGADMAQLTEILLRYKAYNAANLDGGASTNLVVNGNLYNNPVAYTSTGERWINNGWILK